MRTETGRRRAALDGLLRILEAAGLEELFGGPDEEALFLYHLLHEVARGRSSPYYWEICHTGRRRGVTPEYVSDRASVLLASIEERRRTDIYRVLGVPPLASEEVIKLRWHEVAKALHPDVGGDPGHFRQVKEAYEILRDAGRRAEYERFWLRAVGPIARLADGDDGVPAAPAGVGARHAHDARAPRGDGRGARPAPADRGADERERAHAPGSERAPRRRAGRARSAAGRVRARRHGRLDGAARRVEACWRPSTATSSPARAARSTRASTRLEDDRRRARGDRELKRRVPG
jgi:curved DNA-binding protein CbpA